MLATRCKQCHNLEKHHEIDTPNAKVARHGHIPLSHVWGGVWGGVWGVIWGGVGSVIGGGVGGGIGGGVWGGVRGKTNIWVCIVSDGVRFGSAESVYQFVAW